MHTRAPICASRAATANPMPLRRVTPVTSAPRPASGCGCMIDNEDDKDINLFPLHRYTRRFSNAEWVYLNI